MYERSKVAGSYTRKGDFVYERAKEAGSYTGRGDFVYGRGEEAGGKENKRAVVEMCVAEFAKLRYLCEL